MFTVNRGASRRGVILLIVLSLLAMFGLVGISFLVITSHNKRATKTLQKVDQQAFSPQDDAQQAILQVVRGTAHADSVLATNSLLEDLYGNGSVNGQVVDVLSYLWVGNHATSPPTIPVPADPQDPYWQAMRPLFFAGRQILELTIRDPSPQQFVGRAITFRNGPLAGVTTRVIGLRQPSVAGTPLTWLDNTDPNDPPFDRINVFGLSSPDDSDLEYPGRPVWKIQVLIPQQSNITAGNVNYFLGNQFVINGSPFSGTGFGLPDLAGGAPLNQGALLDAGYGVTVPSPQPYALLPNPTLAGYHRNGPISANEDYDAVDYQNMLLALVQANGQVPSPSLHRPALINYWVRLFAADTSVRPEAIPLLNAIDPSTVLENLTDVERLQVFFTPYSPASQALGITRAIANNIVAFKRGFILRPLSNDHPNFDGSNPGFDSTLANLVGNGTWDVDNDGDGIRDSIWVDLGLPVRQTPGGRKYKPLFAILCTDLDGRLNLNAHGCPEQLRSQYTGAVLPHGSGLVYANLGLPPLPRGQGCGPAEINLGALFLSDPTEYRDLLLGNWGLNGRYGETQLTVWPAMFHLPAPGRSQLTPIPLVSPFDGTLYNDPLSANMHYPLSIQMYDTLIPAYYDASYLDSWTYPSHVTTYGTPIDMKGTFTVGSDLRGQPIYSVGKSVSTTDEPSGYVAGWNTFPIAGTTREGSAWDGAGVNDPYELDLTKRISADNLNQPAPEDAPFTLGELERVLRPFDVDTAVLPDRLLRLAPLLNPQPSEAEDRRFKVTTESWDLPCPAAATPVQLLEDFRDQLRLDFSSYPILPFPGSVVTAEVKENDLFRWALSLFPPRSPHAILAARMYINLRNDGVNDAIWPDDGYAARDAIEGSLPSLMSTDLLAGLKMDINRPFGNGRDDGDNTDNDGDSIIDEPDELGTDTVMNGVVDEPTERFALAAAGLTEQLTLFTNDAGGTVNVPFDHDNDGITVIAEHNPALPLVPPADPYCAYRQAYARHLYVLMMALTDPNWYPPENLPPAPPYPSPEHNAARAKAIAQWAVNVVDFRDRDGIMTPFEYDIDPFINSTDGTYTDLDINNTWDVDGIIDPTPPPFPVPLPISPDDVATHRGLVWGCERPELLITETMAFHDRRTEDLPDDGGTVAAGTDNNTDFDQRYRPQGSLFIELFNPQSPSDARPAEFYYDRAAATWRTGVVLNQGTPASAHPVWRMVIVVPATPTDNQIVDPDDPAAGVTIERSLYFLDPSVMAGMTGDGQQFYTTAGMAPILNNRYALIGPGDPGRPGGPGSALAITKISFENPGPQSETQGRRIVLTPNTNPNTAGQVLIDGEGNGVDDLLRPEPATYPPGLGVPPRTEDAIRPTVAVIIDQPRRLSVSEPIAGYVPAGVYTAGIAGYQHATVLPSPQDMTTPAPNYWSAILDTDDTHPKFRVLHLQRLANPLQDYDSQTNPYRTVDSAQIDLTVFNGVTAAARPAYITPPSNPAEYRLFTRERGETTSGTNNLWRVTITPTRPTDDHGEGAGSRYVRTVANPHFFGNDFSHTLGYLNEHFGDPRRPDDGDSGTTDDVPDTPSYLGDPTRWRRAGGDNPRPFPWLNWNNRPFVSHLELPLVPASSSSRMLVNYSMVSGANPYETGAATFSHLLNFFYSDETSVTPPPAHFSRLLEFVHVPSRFVGTQDQINPTMAVGSAHAHHPPFQWVSRYREPGRINLNTLFNPDVYTGLMNSQPGLAGLGSVFEDSRRGYGPAGAGFSLDPASPTRFANPFRSSSGLQRVPMVTLGTGIGSLGGTGAGTGQDVNATLLRADPGATPRFPLWSYDPGTPPVFYDSDRNPYFRYQGMQRLGNLATTRSNVYAVWVTVGYFEVERRELSAAEIAAGITSVDRKVYLEGYTLGRELGGDTGEVERHRAFYVIDRSIPVAFQRGKDLNTEKAIVLRRFIE